MKWCAYCGRESSDEAARCAECGTAEFALAIPPPPPEKFGPVITRRTKIIYAGATVMCLLILGLILRFGGSAPQLTVRAAISFPGNPTLTTTGLAFVVSNQTDKPVVYLQFPPQLKSNDVWIEGPRLAGPWRMLTLPAHQAVTNFGMAPARGETCRVPVLWAYQPTLSNWRFVKHWALTLVGRNSGFKLETYTNFSPEIRSP
jgi:hypothetical protein